MNDVIFAAFQDELHKIAMKPVMTKATAMKASGGEKAFRKADPGAYTRARESAFPVSREAKRKDPGYLKGALQRRAGQKAWHGTPFATAAT